jgi:hypothetical protein
VLNTARIAQHARPTTCCRLSVQLLNHHAPSSATSSQMQPHLQGLISKRPGEPMGLLLAVMGSKMLAEAHQPGLALPLSGYTWSSGQQPDSEACRKMAQLASAQLRAAGSEAAARQRLDAWGLYSTQLASWQIGEQEGQRKACRIPRKTRIQLFQVAACPSAAAAAAATLKRTTATPPPLFLLLCCMWQGLSVGRHVACMPPLAAHLVVVMVCLWHQVPVLVCCCVELPSVTRLLPVHCVCVLLAAGEDWPLGSFHCCAMWLWCSTVHQAARTTLLVSICMTCSTLMVMAAACYSSWMLAGYCVECE